MLGSIKNVSLKGIDWAIIGGESGPGYRKVEREWIVDLIRQCKRQKVPVFFKQWGGTRPKSGGREINGQTYGEYPPIKTTEKSQKQLDKLVDKAYAAEPLPVSAKPLLERDLIQIAQAPSGHRPTRTRK